MPDTNQGLLTGIAPVGTPSSLAPTNVRDTGSLTPAEMENPTNPAVNWTDDYAMKIAKADFQKAEAYRSMNHDNRYTSSEQMYLGWKKNQTWEGTKIPRSAVPIFIGLEQVEGMLPSVVSALFPDNNELPFDVEPYPGTTVQQSESARDLVASQLRDVGEPGKSLSMRELVRRALKSSLIYGLGPVEFGIYDVNVVRTQFQRIDIPLRQPAINPNNGQQFMAPTGQFKSMVRKMQTMEHIVKPIWQNVDVRDWYFDPNCSSPNPNDGSFCAVRNFMTVNELLDLSETEGFKIPNAQQLHKLALVKNIAKADQGKSNQEAYRGNTYQPTIDYSTDPAQARVEVIRYWQSGRHVWMLARQWCAYNQINPYGMLPFLNAFYIDVPGRHAGLSIFDLVEGDQKLAEAIINARIDELNLLIHPPLIKKAGRSFSASQQRLRPGVIWESEDPKNDFIRFEMGNITQEAYIEVQALENRVQKKTGVTDLAVLGTPASGGNSANRTATGVSSQASASGKRLTYHVENFEDQFLNPALDIMLKLDQLFIPKDQLIQILGPESQMLSIDPVEVANASVRFKMCASAKMKMRATMLQGGLQLLMQSYLNPEMQDFAMQQGYKFSFKQSDRLVSDTLGLPPLSLWEEATPQDAQQYIQMKMAPAMLKRQEQADRLQSQQTVAQGKDETTLIAKLLEKILTPDVAHKLINELTGANLTLPSDIPPQAPAQ